MKPILLIHGGAGSKKMTSLDLKNYQLSLNRILNDIFPRLRRGLSAIDAVVMATALLENDPLYNAGKGSKIQSDGHIRMSASVMDGRNRIFSGCVNVEKVKNPIYLAKALQKREDRVLSGKGAERFARENNLEFASAYTKKARIEYLAKIRGKTGTVGAVALDRRGNLASATSTGGKGFEYPHRVSDTPTIAGNFANSCAAVSATGIGEQIVEQGVAVTLCAHVEMGMSIHKAASNIMKSANKRGDQFGFIGVDNKGNFIATTSTKNLIWAGADVEGFHFFA